MLTVYLILCDCIFLMYAIVVEKKEKIRSELKIIISKIIQNHRNKSLLSDDSCVLKNN